MKTKLNYIFKRILVPAIALLMLLTAAAAFAAEKYPAHRGTAVNDFAGVIDAESAAKMEGLAREVLQKTGAAVWWQPCLPSAKMEITTCTPTDFIRRGGSARKAKIKAY